MNKRKVGYICDEQYLSKSDQFIPTENRNAMVHSLISACGLLEKLTVYKPRKADLYDLQLFHGSGYLDKIQSSDYCSSEDDGDCDEKTLYGLEYDCPVSDGLLEYCKVIAGGSISAADMLCIGHCDVALHWSGGWHHAKRNEASGFCYVNDCVLAILRLRKRFGKVLYVDLDLHHGDGVQEAFYATNKVLTYSVHKYEPGFFPGSGSLKDVGSGKGMYHTVNVPLMDGIHDGAFVSVNKEILTHVYQHFKPDAIVCQVGADGLSGDPMKSFCLTSEGLRMCVDHIMQWNLPTLVLGGGGYNQANVAKCWCTITASILNHLLPTEIPEHDFFPMYGPDFMFGVDESNKKDTNSAEYLSLVTDKIKNNIAKLC